MHIIYQECNEKNIERMIKYAKAIQDVQKDMGIKTTSFPHLLLYGDVFKLLEHKNQKASGSKTILNS